MTNPWFKCIAGALVLLVTACGPLQPQNRLLAPLKGLAAPIFGGSEQEAAAAPSAPLARDFIEAQDTDFLRLSIISRESTALLVPSGRNGSKVTWVSPEGIAIIFQDGLLIGTRGLGDDLMGADISGVRNSFSRGGNHVRTLEYLDGLDSIERQSFQCSTVLVRSEQIEVVERFYQTNVFEETCSNEALSFKNVYWRDSNGVIWQSRQWISAQEEYLGYQRL